MLEVVLLKHGRLVYVIVRRYAIIVGNLGQHHYVFVVVAADVHVKKDRVAKLVLPPYEMLKMGPDRSESLGQAWLFVNSVHCKVHCDNASITPPIHTIRTDTTPF